LLPEATSGGVDNEVLRDLTSYSSCDSLISLEINEETPMMSDESPPDDFIDLLKIIIHKVEGDQHECNPEDWINLMRYEIDEDHWHQAVQCKVCKRIREFCEGKLIPLGDFS
jgi:hypothetical protein